MVDVNGILKIFGDEAVRMVISWYVLHLVLRVVLILLQFFSHMECSPTAVLLPLTYQCQTFLTDSIRRQNILYQFNSKHTQVW